MKEKKTILEEAQEIIFDRSEEKQRDYGPIDESFENAATIASILTGKDLTAEDCYKVLIGLKMARMKRSYKRDTYLDSAGYIGALADYLERNTNDEIKRNSLSDHDDPDEASE